MHDCKRLNVWQGSVGLVTEVYKITGSFPDREEFGIISQINRSALSISFNIAEYAVRNIIGELKIFYVMHADHLRIGNPVNYCKQFKIFIQ